MPLRPSFTCRHYPQALAELIMQGQGQGALPSYYWLDPTQRWISKRHATAAEVHLQALRPRLALAGL